ncbi:GNAT family N-acetyltransferase [Bacillus sp. ISL-51]|uniref:GNAT family N-acetyltransferase n=1 Tax=Bacteria TaxID=2 RepID=UPI001BE8EAE1|nr:MULTISPECIES: GNAT family N-acetyltransferase [Bacteria]MBT2575788.1 GNAT family N-acetyltransferase [Bacillus sp. ISL-51]MBT2635840.1 GNAT family N-acetyltransferase [Bacillus sp. ISL-26]MBT2714030.1 GNAT family N-acetyltransferase [Pseudomonas sp. ISL-88]
MEWLIRAMESGDIKQVRQVAKQSWHHTYEGIIPEHIQDQFLQSAYHDEMMERRIEQSLLLAAEAADGTIAGFANFSPVQEGGKAELAAIYIDPDYQGNGIGTALLKEGIQKSGGIKELYVHVKKENQAGMSFYKAKGVEWVSAFEEDFEGHLLQTVKMVLRI